MGIGWRYVIAASLVMLGPLAGCSRGSAKVPRAEIARVTDFCGLLPEFRRVAGTSGAAPTPASFTGPPAAFASLVEQLGPKLDQLQTTAPKEVGRSVEVIVDAVRRAKDNDTSGTRSDVFRDGIQQVDRFQQSRCQTKMPDQVTG